MNQSPTRQLNLMLRRRICTHKRREKKHFLKHKANNKMEKKFYTVDKLKNIGKKIGFATIFTDITKNEALSEQANSHSRNDIFFT